MATAVLTSASGLLALLDEPQPEMKEYALKQLNNVVNEFWAEIAASIAKIEILNEDEKFTNRELAALVASKVYYHLEQYPESIAYALGAGKLFDVSQSSQYVDTLVAKCIDEYINLCKQKFEGKEAVKIDSRLENVVLGMFERCFHEKQFKQALGIALETRQLDKVKQAITQADDVPGMLVYAQKMCMDVVENREFRRQVLRLLITVYNTHSVPNYVKISEILTFLDDSKAIAEILDKLIRSPDNSGNSSLLAYQIAFDLVENATQSILSEIRSLLNVDQSSSTSTTTTTSGQPTATPAASSDAMDIDTKGAAPIITKPVSTSSDVTSTNNNNNSGEGDSYSDRKQKLGAILSGETSISLYLDFLSRNNNTDLLILKNIKNTVEARSSVLHTATIASNALMHSGTTSDAFLRENLEWLSRATNWAKFSAIAGLGVIHKGHLKEGLSLLAPYLPQANGSSSAGGSAYSEGGSLFALGLIHANHGANMVQYLTRALRNANGNEVIEHGACLGLGVAAMATGNDEVYEILKEVLYRDSAVAGEAAGISMGLVMLGTASSKAISEMIAYAHDTQHEKIIRGLAIGLALVMYAREEEADPLIEQLILDKDPILRYGAMYTIGLAHCGTASNAAIRRLLHIAVSDVSDDVRRAAVTSLGLLLFKQPEQCPKVVSLLAESYNPHVRYGACLALGISCAGTALKEAVEILEPLTSDVVDFVRQGALIALSMVLIQTSKQQESRVEQIRKLLEEKISDKHEDIMCKFGAILATGIIDAGGRNVTISLHSRSGHKNMSAIIGLALFTQYWYWYPLTYFITLAFTPTALIGLNKDLKMPVFSFKSNARPSLFAYPPKVVPPTKEAPTKVHTAVLSVSKKNQAKKAGDKMEIDTPKKEGAATTTTATATTATTATTEKKEGETAEIPKEKKKREPEFEVKQNPARVTVAQIRHLSFDTDERYEPIKSSDSGAVFGITLLRDKKPGQPEELVSPTAAAGGAGGKVEDEEEAPAPEPFVYDPTKE